MKAKSDLMGDLIFYPLIVVLGIITLATLAVIVPFFVLCIILAIVGLMIYVFFYLVIGGIRFCIDYLFIIHKEKIEGNIIALRKKYEQLFIPVNVLNSENYNYMSPDQIIFITNYFLKIKKGIMWYTVKVPENVFLKIQNDFKNGIKNISLDCEKYDYDKFYNLSSN
jgi:hypothetical protein